MNFKVAATKKGITSIRMDLKVDGLTPEIIKRALETTHRGRDEKGRQNLSMKDAN